MIKMFNKKLIYTIILVLIIFNFFMVIAETEILDKDNPKWEDWLKNKKIDIKDSIKIGDRIFTNAGENSYVQKIDENVFLVDNVKIMTGQNQDQKLTPLDIEIKEESQIIFGENAKYDTNKNFIKITGDDKTKKIETKYGAFNIKYDKNNPPKFVIGKGGRLTTGTKFTTTKSEYELRGYKIPLPDDSEVEYLEKKVIVKVKSGSKIETPAISNSDEYKNSLIEIQTKDVGSLNIPSMGNYQSAEEETHQKGITKLYYKFENNRVMIFTKDKVGGFFNDNSELDFAIVNPRDDEIELVSTTKNVDASKKTVIVGDKEIGSVSINGEGPIINIGSGSRLSGETKKLSPGKKTISFQSKNGYAIISEGLNGDNPLIRLQGDSIYAPDGKSFLGSGNKFYYNPGNKILGINHGDGTIPINVKLFDKENKPLPYVILTNDNNEHILAPEKDLSGPAKYFVSDKGNVFSANAAFNQLGPKARKDFTFFGKDDQNEIFKQLKNGGNIAAIENSINKMLEQYNPLRSSVTLNGCSGTLVGFHNGKPMVLTAAHCVNGIGSTREVWLKDISSENMKSKLHQEKGIYSKVVAYSQLDYEYGIGNDLALLELSPSEQQLKEIKKRGFSKIIPPSQNLNIGDEVTMIGCPTYTFYSFGCNINELAETTGTNSLTTNKEAYKGMSGGGLFKEKYLVGVTSGTVYKKEGNEGGYANPKSIYDLLDKSGYSSLYKIIFIITRI